MNDFPSRLRAALDIHSPRKKYLIGVSGGRDSMALLHALGILGYHKLVVCHLDHGLRGRASKKDASLVRAAARALQFPFEHSQARVVAAAVREGKSIELAARDARLAFFTTCARKHRCRRVFLAHHADDQVETCLFNFLRGSGAAGLAGMKPVSKIGILELIRPMLGITREEITLWTQSRKIAFHEDASNSDTKHARNRLRHIVLPAIEKAMPAAKAAILRASDILREENAWMESMVPPASARLKTSELREMPHALRRRVVHRWLIRQGIAEAGFQDTELVLSLLDTEVGPAKVNLPGNIHARRRQGEIFLEK